MSRAENRERRNMTDLVRHRYCDDVKEQLDRNIILRRTTGIRAMLSLMQV